MKVLDYYKDKVVLVTGHTGFKGAWLVRILHNLGAKVVGYSLGYPTNPCLFDLAHLDSDTKSIFGDIANYEMLEQVFKDFHPEVVFHLAAQPLVREGYLYPLETYKTNVMGTVNLLECVRRVNCVESLLNITTDKVYKNNEWCWGYREFDALDGFDPYSNSKSCSELVTHSYKQSFFDKTGVKVSTARAGNVIGGGDFAKDRIIPDCVRSIATNSSVIIRNPDSIRPYQHVLEPLFAYLGIVALQANDAYFSDYYNVGPSEDDCVSTAMLVNLFEKFWQADSNKFKWKIQRDPLAVHEANFLKLDCSLIRNKLGWRPTWNIEKAVEKTCDFTSCYYKGSDLKAVMDTQIDEFIKEACKSWIS